MIPLVVLLALKLAWPPNVEVSSGATCKIILTTKAAGDCEVEDQQGGARWWRSCGYIVWAGRGPEGTDILAEINLWAGDSRHKAMEKCEDYLKAYEKVRNVKK